jgi:environmental stress-induced protein Ves
MKQFTKDDFIVMPWKNGGGFTTQLYIYPEDIQYKLRLSVAKVSQDGPFSFFPGYERNLLILNGHGCRLKTYSQAIELDMNSSPYIFQGEEEIFCSLKDGELSDFNVMVRRDWGKASVRKADDEIYKSDAELALIYLIKENTLIQLDRDELLQINSLAIIVEIRKAG